MKRLFTLGVAFVALFTAQSAQAGTDTWTAGTSADWNTPGDWSGGLPTSTSNATFGGTTTETITLDTGGIDVADGLVFGNTGTTTLTGVSGSTLTLSGDGIAVNSGGPVNISTTAGTVDLGTATQTWTNSSASLLTVGAISNTIASTLTLDAASTGGITLSGIISNGTGNTALVVASTGSGATTLSGANTYSGGTIVNGGILEDTNASATDAAFGTGTVTVNSGGTVILNGLHGSTNAFLNSFTLNGGSALDESASYLGVGSGTNAAGNGILTITGTGNKLGATQARGTSASSGTYAIEVSGYTQGTGALTIQYSGLTPFGSITGDLQFYGSDVIFNGGATDTAANNSYTGTITVAANSTSTASNGGGDYGGNYLQINGQYALANAIINLAANETSGNTADLLYGASNSSSLILGTTAVSIGGLEGSGNLELQEGSLSSFGSTGSGSISSTAVALTVGNSNISTSTTYSGILSGSGSLTYAGTGTLTLSGTNTYTGTTTVNAGTLTLDFANSSTATNIIKSGNALAMGGGTLNLTGKANTTNSQTFGTTTFNAGASAFTINNSATANLDSVTLGTLTRNVGSTVTFNQPVNGTVSATNGYATGTGTASTILTASGVAYATVGLDDWAAKDSGNAYIVGLSTLSGYTANTGSTLSGNADMSAGNTTLVAPASITSLRFDAAAANTTVTATGQTLTTGGILVGSNVGANNTFISGGTLEGASGKDLTVIQNSTGTLAVSSVIADNGSATGLTKSGAGMLTLTGPNTYTGTTTLNAGTLNAGVADTGSGSSATAGALGAGSGSIAFDGGTLQYSAASASTDYSSRIKNSTGAISVDTNSQSVTYASGLASTNTGGLTKLGSGTLALTSATGNSYSGATTVSAGTLLVTNTSGSATGSGALSVARGATFGGAGIVTASRFDIGTTGSGTAQVQVGNGSDATSTLTISGTTSTGTPNNIANTNLTFNLNLTNTNSNQVVLGNSTLKFAAVTLTLNLQGSIQNPPNTNFILFAGTSPGSTDATGSQYSGLTFGSSTGTLSSGLMTQILSSNLTISGGAAGNLFLYQNSTTHADDIEVMVVPEPSTWAMMLGGLALLVFWQRSRRQS